MVKGFSFLDNLLTKCWRDRFSCGRT